MPTFATLSTEVTSERFVARIIAQLLPVNAVSVVSAVFVMDQAQPLDRPQVSWLLIYPLIAEIGTTMLPTLSRLPFNLHHGCRKNAAVQRACDYNHSYRRLRATQGGRIVALPV